MKISYLHIEDILFIDYSGIITLENGISNMDIIENEIRNLSLNKAKIKLLFDIRNTLWESIETHNTLSAISRKKFNQQNFESTIYTAILNKELSSPTFENEHWFCNKEDAIKWLIEKA
jgi:hypothetical protein